MSQTTATRFSVILPAAGRSRRFGDTAGKSSKLEVELAGKPVLLHAVDLFARRGDVCQIIVAVDPDQIDAFKFRWSDKLGFMGVKIVAGGRTERWETVLNALQAVDEQASHVAVHDAARPVTPSQVIDRVFEAAAAFDAVIPATPVNATLKRAAAEQAPIDEEPDPLDAVLGDAGKTAVEAWPIEKTLPRDHLWLAQTPQAFKRDLLERAYAPLRDKPELGRGVTDDASLVEALGEPVHIVPGDDLNVKITRPADLRFAEAVLGMGAGRSAGDDPLGPKRKFPTWAQMEDE
jgi:2-C-methyl-D-erythritol 4-phosphate cytidylyltransferase